ncbi:MAG: cysteine desulfurase family protein [Aeoliella sp.]
MNGPIYLDHNATTPLAPEVADAMAAVNTAGHANPASQHEPGRTARRTIERARERVAQLLGAGTTGHCTDRLIFTSGGTEANNLALRGIAGGVAAAAGPGQLILSAIEHPSISAVADQMALEGWQVCRLSVDTRGVVDPGQLESLLSPQTRLVSVMLGNNETGVVQPVAQLAEICRTAGIPFHTDAVQAVGKIDVQFTQLGATALSFTAHKFHGPTSIGGLLLQQDTDLMPQLFGGFQQAGLRPGTESVALVEGLRLALELWHSEAAERTARLTDLRDRLERKILSGESNAVVVGAGAERLPHTSNIALVGLDRQAMVMALDLAGVACSTGSACASGSSEPSPVLLAMGCDEGVIGGSVRFSLGAETTVAEIDEAVRRILLVCKQLRAQKEG